MNSDKYLYRLGMVAHTPLVGGRGKRIAISTRPVRETQQEPVLKAKPNQDFNTHFTKEDIQMPTKQYKRRPTRWLSEESTCPQMAGCGGAHL